MKSAAATAPFGPTRWTLIRRAQSSSPEAQTALGELCDAYYQPVFRFLCREKGSEETARELTQEFFARILQRGAVGSADPSLGRFRSYLLGAVKHFLSDRRDHERRLKRGGGAPIESLDQTSSADAEEAPLLQIADRAAQIPDTYFDRQWALQIMERALAATRHEFAQTGKAEQFEGLKPWLVGDTERLSQAEAALALGWSETAVKVAVHRLRKRFREIVRWEIAQTVADGADIDGELRYLVEVLSQG